ncbi:endonuclease/exonuclease/phosphatase family protein [Rhodoferax sp.]|uniref:endonuclease/exonuclease/phosphatase family protein n=1 Tax=Rhodoferax sp. TaxID=50421 RepID=UPI0028434328|nr:endonuclease/exonuclease/phosphatase family protein [Rhodoferax sp.]MDR3367748.1 endonuclease/exonuclease/phosphatase family protein [Rhodoferax sp.]
MINATGRIRVVTYNIHKGVQGMGPTRRLEIHNLAQAIEILNADVVCLQEVRQINRREEKRFKHWPQGGQADFLAPEGYTSVYRTNAVTRDGEHGNALLSRWPVLNHQHEDMSDHRFEQRGLLHVELDALGHSLHVLVVHLGLVRASRVRQVAQIKRYIQREIAPDAQLLVAGDFNDGSSWLALSMASMGLRAWSGMPEPTFPARLPLVQLDHIFARGLQPVSLTAPQGRIWWRMSDHLPLIADFLMLG